MNVVITCEIDKTRVETIFSAYEAGVWVNRDYIAETAEDDSFWVAGFGGNLDDLDNTKKVISSMIVGTIILAKATSLSDLREIDDNVFYRDYANQDLYVKFVDIDPWYIQRIIRAGETSQYSSRAQTDVNGRPTNAEIGGITYEPRVEVGSISASRVEDNLRDNVMVFNPFSFSLDNADGKLDTLREESINLGGRIKKAEVENGRTVLSSDLEVTRNGYVSNVSFPDDHTATITCADPRAIFTESIGGSELTTTDYPDIKESYEGKFKPLALGNLTNVPAIRVESTALDPPDASKWGEDWVTATDYLEGQEIVSDGIAYECDTAHTSSSTTEPLIGASWATYWSVSDNEYEIDFLLSTTEYGNITSISNVYLDGTIYERNVSEGSWDTETYEGVLDSSNYTVDLTTGIISVNKFASGTVSCDCVGVQPSGTSKIHDLFFWVLEEYADLEYINSFFFKDECDIVRARADDYTGGIYISESGTKLKEVIDELAGSINMYLVEKEDRYTLRDLSVDDVTTETVVVNNYDLLDTPSRDYDTDRYMSSIQVNYNYDWTNDEFSVSLNEDDEETAITANSLSVTYEFDCLVDNVTDADTIRDERYDINPPLQLELESRKGLDFKLYDYVLYELQRRNGTVIVPYALYRVIEIDEINRTASLRWIRSIDSSEEIADISTSPYGQGYLYNDSLFTHRLYSATEGAD